MLASLAEWQADSGPFQLHPGDVGWHWRFGAEETAAAVRTWSAGDEVVAVGLHDGPTLRLALAPRAARDEGLARLIAGDILAGGLASVEAPQGSVVRDVLMRAGWGLGEVWTPLSRDLAEPVPDAGLEVEVTSERTVDARVEVQRAAFENSTFTGERWRAMASGPAYERARCLVARDEKGVVVAAATVWSAGEGRPGLIEPLGVHRDHRGHGYGTAIARAAVGALRALGSSSALVCTPAANVAAVATYAAAGLVPGEPVGDIVRP